MLPRSILKHERIIVLHIHPPLLCTNACYITVRYTSFHVTGIRGRKIAEANYNTERVIETGKAVMKEKTKNYRKKQEVDEDGLEIGTYVYATCTLRVRIVTLCNVVRPYG